MREKNRIMNSRDMEKSDHTILEDDIAIRLTNTYLRTSSRKGNRGHASALASTHVRKVTNAYGG
jgi:hypothetical protein